MDVKSKLSRLDLIRYNLNVPVVKITDGFVITVRFNKEFETEFCELLQGYYMAFDDVGDNKVCFVVFGNVEDKARIKNLVDDAKKKVSVKKNARVLLYEFGGSGSGSKRCDLSSLLRSSDCYIDFGCEYAFEAMACGTWTLTKPNEFIKSFSFYSLDRFDAEYFKNKLKVVYNSRSYIRTKIINELNKFLSIVKVHNKFVKKNDIANELISIIILTYDNLDKNKECISSILSKTDYDNYEIVVFDNGSKDGTVEWLRELNHHRIHVYFSDVNLGFAKGCNKASELARGQYLLFMNNDIIVGEKSWMTNMINVFSECDNVGVVGNKSLFEDNTIQHAGVVTAKLYGGINVVHEYKGYSSDDFIVNQLKKVDAVTGACLMIKKDVFYEADRFCELYKNSYEDIDLCFKIKEKGYDVWYQPKSVIYHFEASSMGRFDHEDENRILFNKKWLSKYDKVINKKCVAVKTIKKNSEINILFIAPTLPTYDRDSGGNRFFEILKILRGLEYNVDLLVHSFVDKKYLLAVNELGIHCREGNVANNVNVLIQSKTYDVCVFAWHNMAIQYIEYIRSMLPGVKIVVDSVDVHWVREKRGIDSGELKMSLGEYDARKNNEKAVYNLADEVYAVTENDKNAIEVECADANVKIVSNIHRKHDNYLDAIDGNGIIFVGGFNHPPNVGAAIWGSEICDKVRKKLARNDIPYYIVGSNPPEQIKKMNNGTTDIVTGFVDSLEPWYKKSKIMIAPLKYGAGIKGKVCHGVCGGLPVIVTDVANEGICLADGVDGLVANTTDEFVDKLCDVYSGKYNLDSFRENALGKVLAVTGEESAKEVIGSSMQFKSIIISIVTYNKKDLLKKCLDSIIDKTEYLNYKIAVVSNGCTDGTKEMLDEYIKMYPEKIESYYNNSNEYFVKPNNFVINKYLNSDIVLLNNDTEIIDGRWLNYLYDSVYSSGNIGAAGGKVIDDSGVLSEAGAEIFSDGSGRNIGRGDNPDKNDYNIKRYVGYVSGCLLYMRRDAINKFGALDEDFAPMYYEDSAWQYNLHKNGYYTIYEPKCVIIHKEGSTAGTDVNTGMKKYQEINKKKFVDKFGEHIN